MLKNPAKNQATPRAINCSLLGVLLLASCAASAGLRATSTTSQSAQTNKYAPRVTRFPLNTKLLSEASGIAVSRRDPTLLWAHNDSGDWSTIYALTVNGKYRGRVDILGADAFDWEDIAAFEYQGQPWLLIGDIGDNFGFRALPSLYLLREPELSDQGADFKLDAHVARRINFKFEDGSRDVEAVAVDANNDAIYLLSKRDDPPRLYRLPLTETDAGSPLIAKHVATLRQLPRVSAKTLEDYPKQGRYRAQPTALDISADGTTWLITTYQHALLYRRSPGQPLAQLFAEPPQVITLPRLPQTEGGALSKDAEHAYFVSEKAPKDLVVIPLDKSKGAGPHD